MQVGRKKQRVDGRKNVREQYRKKSERRKKRRGDDWRELRQILGRRRKKADTENEAEDAEAESLKAKEDLEQRCVGFGKAEKTILLLIILPPPSKQRRMKHIPVK